MLTVKLINDENYESVFEAREVSIQRPKSPEGGVDTVWYTKPDGEIITIERGSVYVMNDKGQTVATYRDVGKDCVSQLKQKQETR